MEVENSSNIICNLIPQQENFTTPVTDEIEAPQTPSTIFKCKEVGCGKIYTGISGLNGHIKKLVNFLVISNLKLILNLP